MTIPVRCDHCHQIACLKRMDFAWATFCNKCFTAEIKYDEIHMGQEDQR